MSFFFKDVEDIVNPDTPDEIKGKVRCWLKIHNTVFGIFMAYLLGSIIIGYFFNISLTLDYPTLDFGFMYVMLFIICVVAIRFFFLYKEIGKSSIYLRRILLQVLASVAIVYLVVCF